MWTAKWILDAYEQGDQSVRWEMYMTYPQLRGYFDQVESRPAVADGDTGKKSAEGFPLGKWNLYARLVKGLGS